MNLFKLTDFIQTLALDDVVEVICTAPGVADIVVNGEYNSTITITDSCISVRS